MKEKSLLIRIAASTEGEIQIGDKIPGRGAYVCRNEKCVKKATKIKGAERSLKRAVPAEIYTQLNEAVSQG
jgi:predicted RNA-binding protein YlxR (DUF448 family)